jgi:hypothetical protein
MSSTLFDPSFEPFSAEINIPAVGIGAPEDFIVRTMAPAPAFNDFSEARTMSTAPALPSSGNMFRTYTPPAQGSFDPFTAAMTGGIPSFFSYRQGPPPGPSDPPSDGGSDGTGGGGTGGGDGGGTGGQPDAGLSGGGTGYGSIGSTTEGGLTGLGPNPGNLGGSVNLSDINLSDFSSRGALRGGMTGLSFGGIPGAIAGALIGGLAPSFSDARSMQETARAQAELHDRAVQNMIADLDFQSLTDEEITSALARTEIDTLSRGGPEGIGPSGFTTAEEAAMAAGTQSPGFGTGSYGYGASPTAGGSGNFGAMSAAERGESVGPPGGETNTTSPGETSTSPGAPGGEASESGGDMGGGPSGDSGDGYKEGGLVAFAEGGAVSESERRPNLLQRIDRAFLDTFVVPNMMGVSADQRAKAEGIPGGAGGPRDAIRHMVGSSYTGPAGVFAAELFAGDTLGSMIGDNQARWDRTNNALGQRLRDVPEGERYGRARDMVLQQLRHLVEYGEMNNALPSFDPNFTVVDRDAEGQEIVYGPREIIGWIESGAMPRLSSESQVLRGDTYAPGSIGERIRPSNRSRNRTSPPAASSSNFAGGGVVALEGGGKVAIGPGGGLDDLIPTSIDGRRAAALSDGEFVIPADVVSMMGDGSSNAGARRLYDLVRQVRDNKTGTTRQAGPLPVGDILKRSMG